MKSSCDLERMNLLSQHPDNGVKGIRHHMQFGNSRSLVSSKQSRLTEAGTAAQEVEAKG